MHKKIRLGKWVLVATLLFAAVIPARSHKKSESDSKVKVCFLKTEKVKGEKGEFLFIRLTPEQYRSAKAKAKLKRRKGIVRLALHPREIHCINDTLGLEKKLTKVVLRVSAKRFRTAKGLKGHYIVRSRKQFEKGIRDGVFEEK